MHKKTDIDAARRSFRPKGYSKEVSKTFES